MSLHVEAQTFSPGPGIRLTFLKVSLLWMRKVLARAHTAIPSVGKGPSTQQTSRQSVFVSVGGKLSHLSLLLPWPHAHSCPPFLCHTPSGNSEVQTFFFHEGNSPLRLPPPWVDKTGDIQPGLESAKEIRHHNVTRPSPSDLLPIRRGDRQTARLSRLVLMSGP